jgi:hypothetical protein
VLREVQVTASGDADGSARQMTQTLAEGGKLKTVFLESQNPMTPAGSYLLYTGGDLVVLVDPARNTLTHMEVAAMKAFPPEDGDTVVPAAAPGNGAAEVVDVALIQLLDEPGPRMLDFPTRHYRYEFSYTLRQRLGGAPDIEDTRVLERHEFWATSAIEDAPAMTAIRVERIAGAQDDELRRALEDAEAHMAAHGLVLKRIVLRDSSRKAAGTVTERISTEVTELRRATVASSEFELPKGYAETEMFAPDVGGMPDMGPLPEARDGGAVPGHEEVPP